MAHTPPRHRLRLPCLSPLPPSGRPTLPYHQSCSCKPSQTPVSLLVLHFGPVSPLGAVRVLRMVAHKPGCLSRVADGCRAAYRGWCPGRCTSTSRGRSTLSWVYRAPTVLRVRRQHVQRWSVKTAWAQRRSTAWVRFPWETPLPSLVTVLREVVAVTTRARRKESDKDWKDRGRMRL